MFMSILALFTAMQLAPEAERTPCRSDTNLVGTWRVVQSRGQSWPDDRPVHKHFTPTHFIVIEWDPAAANTLSRAHGGTYEVGDDGTYVEAVVYGFGETYAKVAGRPFRMQGRCWVRGDEWHIEGEAPGFPPVDFTWVRVTSAP
jgi:hypothetical protein